MLRWSHCEAKADKSDKMRQHEQSSDMTSATLPTNPNLNKNIPINKSYTEMDGSQLFDDVSLQAFSGGLGDQPVSLLFAHRQGW